MDFLFPSIRYKGAKPLSPDSILEKSIRPALQREGIAGKRIGWHSFRHSLGTNLRSLGVDIKVAQELLRHASCRTTLDVYTRAVDQQKREASLKVVAFMLPLGMTTLQHPSAPSEEKKTDREWLHTSANKGVIWWTWSGSNRRPLPCHNANYRRHSTYQPAQPAKTAQSALFAGKMRAKINQVASGLIVRNQPEISNSPQVSSPSVPPVLRGP